MTQENSWTSGRLGPFHLGASHALGPGLGQLYEAWHSGTGAPVLLLRPGDEVEWRPEGPWRVQLSFEPEWSAVVLLVERAPLVADVSELANLLVLSTAAVTRLEDHPQVRSHLATQSGAQAKPPTPPAARRRPSWRGVALAGLAVLALGGAWRLLTSSRVQTSGVLSQSLTSVLGNSQYPGATPIAFPMPARPFDNQAAAPCYPELDEAELNGGCWFEVARRPPCLEKIQAEHKGKCYLPISKDRGKKPGQSAQP